MPIFFIPCMPYSTTPALCICSYGLHFRSMTLSVAGGKGKGNSINGQLSHDLKISVAKLRSSSLLLMVRAGLFGGPVRRDRLSLFDRFFLFPRSPGCWIKVFRGPFSSDQ
jgi:hypothetical protein